MKSLLEFLNESITYTNESILDIDKNMSDDDLKLFAAKWLSENNSYKINIDPSSITVKNGEINVDYNGNTLLILYLTDSVVLPFKLGKFDGVISVNYTKNTEIDGNNLPSECYGILFNHVSKLKWNNAHVKIKYYSKAESPYNVFSFYKSPRAIKSLKNITVEFVGEWSRYVKPEVRISDLKTKMMDNLTLINCKGIHVLDKIEMKEEDIQKLKGVDYVNFRGNIINIKK